LGVANLRASIKRPRRVGLQGPQHASHYMSNEKFVLFKNRQKLGHLLVEEVIEQTDLPATIHSDALDWYRNFFLRTLRSPRLLRVLGTMLEFCE